MHLTRVVLQALKYTMISSRKTPQVLISVIRVFNIWPTLVVLRMSLSGTQSTVLDQYEENKYTGRKR